MRVTMFDYGAGNLHSLGKALELSGAVVSTETDPARCVDADVLVLPGVGAFGLAAEKLAPAREAVRAAILDGLPTIGICLGMQLLFDESDEGAGQGLGVIAGRVERLRSARVPQIGWNTVERDESSSMDAKLEWAYYANSYVARPVDASVIEAWSEYDGDRFPAVVTTQRAIGVQFHPEKSTAAGTRFLADALRWCTR